MQRALLFTATTLAILLGGFASDCRAEWINYLVRTSGLGWSDGYHAKDQCPPRGHGHFPVRHPVIFPSYGVSEGPAAPYYFEEPAHKASAQPEQLPSAPQDVDPRTPSPQARYQPRNPYFQALRAEQQGGVPAQPQTLQARRPESRPPF